MLRQLAFDPFGVGIGPVYLVDCNYYGNARGLDVIDGLDRLRHNSVVGRDDENCYVG